MILVVGVHRHAVASITRPTRRWLDFARKYCSSWCGSFPRRAQRGTRHGLQSRIEGVSKRGVLGAFAGRAVSFCAKRASGIREHRPPARSCGDSALPRENRPAMPRGVPWSKAQPDEARAMQGEIGPLPTLTVCGRARLQGSSPAARHTLRRARHRAPSRGTRERGSLPRARSLRSRCSARGGMEARDRQTPAVGYVLPGQRGPRRTGR